MKFVMYAVASIAIVYFAGVAAGMMAIHLKDLAEINRLKATCRAQ